MTRPLPENLKQIYDVVGEDSARKMHDDVHLVVDGVEFVGGYVPESTAERFYIVKSNAHLAHYEDFLSAHPATGVLELGIAEGGSTALLALRPEIEMLVALDNEVHRLPALDEFIERRGFADRVHAYYGVDQADDAAVGEIADRHFGTDTPLELVIDDASHVYDLTVRSFNTLFPRVAEGGWYVIEDWSQRLKLAETFRRAAVGASTRLEDAGHVAAGPRPDRIPNADVPLERIAFDWVAAMGAWPGAIRRLEMNDLFIACERGWADLPPEFALDDLTAAEPAVGVLAPPEAHTRS